MTEICGPCGNVMCAQEGCQKRRNREPRYTPMPNILEQMGADPISRLARAIERLAEALEKGA